MMNAQRQQQPPAALLEKQRMVAGSSITSRKGVL
jgi:hypothetical protein